LHTGYLLVYDIEREDGDNRTETYPPFEGDKVHPYKRFRKADLDYLLALAC